jgi:cytochrome P450
MKPLTSADIRIEDPGFYFEGRRPGYEWLHAECPVFYYEPLDVFVLTKHEDIRQAARHPEIFSSAHGLHLHQLRLTPDEVEVYATLYGSGEQFGFADPPRHRELRGVATRIFAPRSLERLGDRVKRDIAELVGKIEPGKSLDFVEEVAAVLPIRVATALIGLPSGHDADIRRWSDALESLKLIHGADNIRAAVRQFSEMDDFFRAQFVIKRAAPGDDLISTLLAAELDGKPITEANLLTYCSTFLAAGSDTTRSLLAGMALALAEHPDQLEKLRENPGLLDGAIEESLRWTTPARGFLRTAVADTQVRGVDIKAGQRIYLLYDAGNRDPEVFDDPWTFDIERPNANEHLGFGYGPHLCIAAHLARLEARELYRALLNAFGKIEVSGEVTEIRQLLRNGWVHVPLTFSRLPGRGFAFLLGTHGLPGTHGERPLMPAGPVRGGDLHQLVQVEPAQRADDRLVLGVDALRRLGLAPPPGGAVEVRHLPEPAHFLADLGERRQVEDREVELAVVPEHRRHVAVFDRDHHLVVELLEPGEHLGAWPLHSAQQFLLEQFPHPVDLVQVVVIEPGHDIAAIDLIRDDALGFEGPQRFPQRTPRHAESFGKLHLQDLLPRQQHMVDDEAADLRGRLQRQLCRLLGRLARRGLPRAAQRRDQADGPSIGSHPLSFLTAKLHS